MLIFAQSKIRVQQLFEELQKEEIKIGCIHNEKEKEEREEIVKQFRKGEIWALICTDLIARGIDFKGVKLVINYDMPSSVINYIHRVGRTGRASRTGKAVTFFTDEDKPFLRSVGNLLKISVFLQFD